MKYVQVFLVHLQDALDARSRIAVWFLISLINPLVYLLFWWGASENLVSLKTQWSLSHFASYYVLLIIASSFLLVHIEEYIAYFDIQQGYLTNHLLKPISYFWYQFFHELPYRVIQGLFGFLVFVLFFVAFPGLIQLGKQPEIVIVSVVVIIAAYFLSFLLKMLLGLSALFTTDFTGLHELIGVVILIFGGFVVPLDLFPEQLKHILFFLPFPYMFYYPIIAIQGRLDFMELLQVLAVQSVWIVSFALFYTFIWKKGVRLFTGVGR